jgi:hypothetical protein
MLVRQTHSSPFTRLHRATVPADDLRSGHHRKVALDLHNDLNAGADSAEQDVELHGNAETLYRRVARAKARWLRRVMYASVATSTEKCFAYAVAEHLNCVTLDAWPGQLRLVQLLGFKSAKTIQRAARSLEDLAVLTVFRSRKNFYRYAPVFLPGDEDKIVPAKGQTGAVRTDTDVPESLLLIHINPSVPSKRLSDKSEEVQSGEFRYRRTERGAIEVKIAAMLGDDGIEVLARLGAIDDWLIERLCRAYAAGALGPRELIAARLAAEQVR